MQQRESAQKAFQRSGTEVKTKIAGRFLEDVLHLRGIQALRKREIGKILHQHQPFFQTHRIPHIHPERDAACRIAQEFAAARKQAGDHGAKGPTGPIGNVGQQGPTGPTGSIGLPGTNAPLTNDNVEILSGGTLGATIGPRAQIQLTPATGSGALPKTAIYMGPGNGASGDGVFSFSPEPGASPQASVQVPTPGGTAFHLQVSIGPTGPSGMGGVGGSYQFVVCNEMSCDLMGLECMSKQNTTLSMVQTCADDTDTLVFAPGDTLSILAFNNENSANTVDVSWSLDFAIDSGDAF